MKRFNENLFNFTRVLFFLNLISFASLLLPSKLKAQPFAVCENHTAILNGSGIATFTVTDIDGGSTNSGCSGFTVQLLGSGNVDCSYVGNPMIAVLQASDDCGTDTCQAVITVLDLTPPTIGNCPPSIVVGCANQEPPFDTTGMLISDNCPGLMVQLASSIGGYVCDNQFMISRSVLIIDASSNTASCSWNIIVKDSIAPILTCPGTVSVGCAFEVPAPNPGSLTVADACGIQDVLVEHEEDMSSSPTCPNRFTITRIYSATDACDNVSTCSQTITVNDQTGPSMFCPPSQMVTCASQVPAQNPALVIAADVCGNMGIIVALGSENIVNPLCPNKFSVHRTYVGTDACGNSNTCVQVITVSDNEAPLISCPPVASVNCASAVPPPNIADVSVSDNCLVAFVVHSGDIISDRTCPNRYTITRVYTATDACFATATCTQTITVNDNVSPTALCKNIAIDLSSAGNASVIAADINNNSSDNCGSLTMSISRSAFTCAEIGDNAVKLTVTDACNNTAQCIAVVTINDITLPTIQCSSFNLFAKGGACGARLTYLPTASDACGTVAVAFMNPAVYQYGAYIPIGKHNICYIATDQHNNTSTCCAQVEVIENTNAIDELACNDNIQISVDENCQATVNADDILEGGPYRCYDTYIIEIRDWNTNVVIGKDTGGVTLSCEHINKEYKVSVIDPQTGNSCWGKVRVEDKLAPIIECDFYRVPCGSNTDVLALGLPKVTENCCKGYTLTYTDDVTYGDCRSGVDRIIRRKFIAIDGFGNRSECISTIYVHSIGVAEVIPPPNYDDKERPAFTCDTKYDPKKDVSAHYRSVSDPSGSCVDGYLLDSAFWLRTGKRLPRVLGWNCIDTGAYAGHPSPVSRYYPAHSPCWGDDERIMWHGSGSPSGFGCRNLALTYTDTRLEIAKPGCDAGDVGCFKIIRQWLIIDWCTSEIREINQIIKVIDNKGPQVIYPDSIVVTMETYACRATWDVPAPWLQDNCSNDVDYSIEVEDGIVLGNAQSGFVVTELFEGKTVAYIVAEDCCGNITKHRVLLHVLDRTPPIAVCDKATVVSLVTNQSTGQALTKVCAKDLDDGSFDNCQNHLFFKVIRMDDLVNTLNGSQLVNRNASCQGVNGDDDLSVNGNQIYFDDCVTFCCEDVGKSITVVMRVFDKDPGVGPVHPSRLGGPGPLNLNSNAELYGHYSDCMVQIEVQDKGQATIIAPPDIVVSCMFWFDLNELSNVSNSTFGRVVSNYADRQKVKTTDIVCERYCYPNIITGYPGESARRPSNPSSAADLACQYYRQYFDANNADKKYELVWGFDGVAIAPCEVEPIITVADYRECGQGRIVRTFTVRSNNNSVVRAEQTIWIVDCDPFYVNTNDRCNYYGLNDIQWPDCDNRGSVIRGCANEDTSPDNPALGRPKILNDADDNCSLISMIYDDQVFTIEPDVCYKILRNWVVIDWCQYDPSRHIYTGRWEHTQVIKVLDTSKPRIICEMGPCEPAVKNSNGVCLGHIRLTATATDDCSPEQWLKWEYKIDAFNNGTYDFIVGPLTKQEYAAGVRPAIAINPYADNINNPFDASGTYPLGVHKIKWIVEDGCGNIGICEKLFEIKDCKAPTPYCRLGLITTVMPTTGCIEIWAKDLDLGSFDNCTDSSRLKFYFNRDPNQPNYKVCCKDFEDADENDELVIHVELCVEDEEGNVECCKTQFAVQDPNNVCKNSGSFGKIVGEIRTEKAESTHKTKVTISEKNTVIQELIDVQGSFAFSKLPIQHQYSVSLYRNDDHLNGVRTSDIVKIQKHILGLEHLTSNYRLIAADVNLDKRISASDISEIRQLILGKIAEFKKAPSWTFVPKAFGFEDPNSLDYPSTFTYNVVERAPYEYVSDWIAIKLGDVDNNALAQVTSKSGSRTNETYNLYSEDLELIPGETYVIPVKAKATNGILGYQFTIELNSEYVEYESFSPGSIPVDASHFGLTKVGQGLISTSYSTPNTFVLKTGEVLFNIHLIVKQAATLSEVMSVNSKMTYAEIYDSGLNALDVRLQFGNDILSNDNVGFVLYQNAPNPMDKQSVIQFMLPESSPVKLSLYDVTGKLILIKENMAKKGLNTISLEKSELGGFSGVLYYQLDADNNTATKKMIVLE